jgi:hypothetical protein
MYGICSTAKGDVKNCVKEMKKQGYSFPIYQLSLKTYKKAEDNQAEVPGIIQKMFPRHSIDVQRGILHRKMCKKAGVRETVLAAITRPSLTGLRKCSCMK